MTRTYLPTRRPSVTLSLAHKGITFHVTVGFDMEGVPREVFGSARMSGSDFSSLLSDACVILSIALQNNIRPADMSKSLGWQPVVGDPDKRQEPSSIIGVIMAALVEEMKR